MAQYKGSSRKHEVRASRRRKDTRLIGQKLSEFFTSPDGAAIFLLVMVALAVTFAIVRPVPFAGEFILFLLWLFWRLYGDVKRRAFDFPYRVPVEAKLRDGSTPKGKSLGTGITMLGNDLETREQIYAGDSDLRTHQLVLGTTGSGKTEYLLGLVFNALSQNTGFIYCDGKGDPALQKNIFKLARRVGREDDLLIINFITSGRDFVEKQYDKVTNNMNMMGNTSSGMLIELIVALMDDSGGGGDMWKGRAISFVAALTRPLVYLRDKGYINLAPESYLDYFELNAIEELVWEHKGKYGEMFDVVCAPLRSYLLTLPGYQKNKIKKQETKTLEQHGFIVMQLTRIFNDLTYNYGHIFKTKVGDVDFYDVVINRRLLVVLLPALERAPDSMRMLGKMIVGSIKQMMAGCLGNRVEGLVREIIDSRPTNAAVPFYTILDEYGYYAVIGFAVAPAQARSLGFSVIFAAQDFSSLKKSSAEEADATWENTNIRAIGRITSGQKSETWERVQGAAGESEEARMGGFERKTGAVNEVFRQQDNIAIERRNRLDYDDLAMQENGEFTFLIGKKEQGGRSGGVRVIRGMGFYTGGGATPKEMRINDFLPIQAPEPADLPQNRKAVKMLQTAIGDGSLGVMLVQAIEADPILTSMKNLFEHNYASEGSTRLSRPDAAAAVMHWFLSRQGNELVAPVGAKAAPAPAPAPVAVEVATPDASEIPDVPETPEFEMDAPEFPSDIPADVPEMPDDAPAEPDTGSQASGEGNDLRSRLLGVCEAIQSNPDAFPTGGTSAPAGGTDDDEISLSPDYQCASIILTPNEADAFKRRALPLLRQHLMLAGAPAPETADDLDDELTVGDEALLKDIELLGRGQPFESLDAKWEAEQQVRETRKAIAKQTNYIDPPMPEKMEVLDASERLSKMRAACDQLLKKTLKED